MAVTVFWMYANDLFPPASAKKRFGLIVAAGAAGGSVGSWLTEQLVARIGTVNMLMVAAGCCSLILAVLFACEQISGGRSAERASGPSKPGVELGQLPAAMRLLFSSRFLMLLTAVACFERLVPDFSDYIFQSLAREAYPSRDSYTRFFAGFEKWRNCGAFVATVFLTGPMLQRLGVRAGLVSVPLSIIILGAGFIFWPGLAAAVLLKGIEEGQRHSWFKAAKEVSYTATDREVIYRIKGYIEMFFYRFARGVAGFLLLLAGAAGLGPSGIAAAMLPLAVLWLWAAWQAGGEFRKLESRRP
jgi:ATP/ADP translocase